MADSQPDGRQKLVSNLRRSIWVDDELWAACSKAAAKHQLKTGEAMNRSKWIREQLTTATQEPGGN